MGGASVAITYACTYVFMYLCVHRQTQQMRACVRTGPDGKAEGTLGQVPKEGRALMCGVCGVCGVCGG